MTKAQQQVVVRDTGAPRSFVFKWAGFEGAHNVWQFPDKAAFDSCNFIKAVEKSKTSPYTFTPTKPGTYYFGCEVGAHCKFEQKVAITITAAGTNP